MNSPLVVWGGSQLAKAVLELILDTVALSGMVGTGPEGGSIGKEIGAGLVVVCKVVLGVRVVGVLAGGRVGNTGRGSPDQHAK